MRKRKWGDPWSSLVAETMPVSAQAVRCCLFSIPKKMSIACAWPLVWLLGRHGPSPPITKELHGQPRKQLKRWSNKSSIWSNWAVRLEGIRTEVVARRQDQKLSFDPSLRRLCGEASALSVAQWTYFDETCEKLFLNGQWILKMSLNEQNVLNECEKWTEMSKKELKFAKMYYIY